MTERYKRSIEPLAAGTLASMRDAEGGLPHFCFPLQDPRWLSPAEAAAQMLPEDPVLGLEFDGAAWALPWWIMKNHHIANLELGGRPVLVTLCEACSSGAAFDPVVDGRRLNFRLEGLYNGTIMPLDYETGSKWTGFTGEAISGPTKGHVMERLPLFQCTWAEWLALHPATRVPDGKDESRVGHGEGHFPGSPMVTTRFRTLLKNIDKRLPHYELVLGARAGPDGNEQARCYPLATLAQEGRALNDELGGVPVAVFSQPGSWLAGAYDRRLDGQLLEFRDADGAIIDAQTGSRWELSGMASAGPLAGRRLKYVNSGIEEYHIWAAFHPATSIHGYSGEAPAVWSVDRIPEPVLEAIDGGWWLPGRPLLDIGCGDGLVSAWAAESGYRVTGVDADAALIARANANFGRLPGLRFHAGDFASSPPRAPQFDLLYDYGLFYRLPAAQRTAYAANAASCAKPGARFLLLLPASAGSEEKLAAAVHQVLAPAFHPVDHKALTLPHPATGKPVPGLALRLLRAGWLGKA